MTANPMTGLTAIANPRWRLAAADPLLAATDALATLNTPQQLLSAGKAVASSRFSRVSQGLLALDSQPRTAVYLKEFIDRGPVETLKNLFRPHRALRALEAERQLAAAGFKVATTLVIGWQQRLGVKYRFFTVTRDLGELIDLYQCARQLQGAALEHKRRWLRAVADAVAQLHREGFIHGDLRPGNLLVGEQGGRTVCAWLDNERTRRFATLPERLRLKNLVQLNMLLSPAIGRRERLCFLLAYCRHFAGLDCRTLCRQVEDRTRQRLHTLVARGRLDPGEVWL